MVLGVLVPGCGEQDRRPAPPAPAASAPAPPLTAAERKRLRTAEALIGRHCVAVTTSLVDPGAAPTPAQEARAYAAADDLIAIARAKPATELDVGQDVRLYLGDVIENLEGANCDPRMVAYLERGFTSIPVE